VPKKLSKTEATDFSALQHKCSTLDSSEVKSFRYWQWHTYWNCSHNIYCLIILCNAQDDLFIESWSAGKLINFLLWEYLSRVNCQLWLLHVEQLGGNPARNALNLHMNSASCTTEFCHLIWMSTQREDTSNISHIEYHIPSLQRFKCKSYDVHKCCSSLWLISGSRI